jgi:UDP-N-acetylglucosamine---dolichyl-phosphate N-acetylglucosaminyltransferase
MSSYTVAVIPAYNEATRIRKTILDTKKYVDNIIVVDDGSPDKTSEVARKTGVEVFRYDVNQGKGYATLIGMKKALALKPRIIILLDADGQHDPWYIPYFVKAIENGADYVCGKRDLSNYPFNRRIGNWGLKVLTNIFCPTGIMDTECGYRALSYEAARKTEINNSKYGRRYGIEMDFAYNVWKNHFKIRQIEIVVPVFHSKAAIKRGFKNFIYLLQRRFRLI